MTQRGPNIATAGNFYGMFCLVSMPDRPAQAEYPDLHLNLWEHDGDDVSLDIGLLIDRTFPNPDVYFYLPWKSQGDQIIELTPRINSANAIAAIFNESWKIGQVAGSTSITVENPADGKPLFQVISPNAYLEVDEQGDHSYRLHLAIGRLLRTETLAAEKIYLRFRVRGVRKEFYAVGLTQGDRGLVSSWTKDEFIDFRLNVRRGAPPNLESQRIRYLSFAKVHLFLMRHRSNELVFQDSAFRSCRSLEDEHFWARYSHPKAEPSPQELAKARTHVTRSLGYQWTRRMHGGVPVHEFGILARFKRIEISILSFLIFAVLIGATGNALWSAIVWIWEKLARTCI